jgi:hypothetical protein
VKRGPPFAQDRGGAKIYTYFSGPSAISPKLRLLEPPGQSRLTYYNFYRIGGTPRKPGENRNGALRRSRPALEQGGQCGEEGDLLGVI